jgi:uncharacterized RDD family membrane protein YckC
VTETTLPAPLWQRLLVAVYDLLPVLALLMVTGAVCFGIAGGKLDYHAAWYRATLLGVIAAYFVVSWSRGGQTIGMRAWRLRLIRVDGGRVPLSAALLRFAVAWVSLLAAGVGFLWIFVDAQGRTWHDLAAGTRVVKLQKP